MAAVTFTYDHSRDPMNPVDLGDKIATALTLTSPPTVDINPTQIIVTHANVAEANRAAIQTVINAYTLDNARVALPSGILGTLLAKGDQAVTVNKNFLAIGSPTQAQTLAEVQSLARQNNAIIKALLNYIAGQTQDTSGT